MAGQADASENSFSREKLFQLFHFNSADCTHQAEYWTALVLETEKKNKITYLKIREISKMQQVYNIRSHSPF